MYSNKPNLHIWSTKLLWSSFQHFQILFCMLPPSEFVVEATNVYSSFFVECALISPVLDTTMFFSIYVPTCLISWTFALKFVQWNRSLAFYGFSGSACSQPFFRGWKFEKVRSLTKYKFFDFLNFNFSHARRFFAFKYWEYTCSSS